MSVIKEVVSLYGAKNLLIRIASVYDRALYPEAVNFQIDESVYDVEKDYKIGLMQSDDKKTEAIYTSTLSALWALGQAEVYVISATSDGSPYYTPLAYSQHKTS